MALYIENNYPGQWPPPLEKIEPSFGMVVENAWETGLAENPTTILDRTASIMQAEQGLTDEDVAGIMDAADSGGLDTYLDENPVVVPRPLTTEEQIQRIKDFGLEDKVKPDVSYTPDALDIIMQAKQEELQREEISAATPGRYLPATLGVGLAATAIDPVNIASAFIPIVGEARTMRLLGSAKSAWGRAGIRASIGATEGAVGGAVIEPLIQLGQSYNQADYDMMDSLLNIGFGAALGATLQPAMGAAGEWLRAKRNQRDPWEVIAPTLESDALKSGLINDMTAAYSAARPDLAPDIAQQHIAMAGALFDTRARTWSFDTGRTVQEYYDRYRPDFKAGEDVEGFVSDSLSQAAMYRSRAATLEDFLIEAVSEKTQKEKSYFDFDKRVFSREDGLISGHHIQLGEDQARHIKTRHPEFEDWGNIPSVIETGKSYRLQKNRVTGSDSYAFVLESGDKAQVVVGAPLESKKGGKRVVVLTSFTDDIDKVKSWLAEKGNSTAPFQGSGGSPEYPSLTNRGALLGSGNDAENSITVGGSKDNTLDQPAYHGTPYKFSRFTLDHLDKGEGAQAHGWGLYFAQDRSIAEGYRSRLIEDAEPVLIVNGKRYTARESEGGLAWRDDRGVFVPEEEHQHLTYLKLKADTGVVDEEYMQALAEWSSDASLTEEQRGILARQLAEYQSADIRTEQPGQVFEADIPDNDVLLDEQKTYTEQPAKVKEAIGQAIQSLDDTATGKMLTDESITGGEIYKALMSATGSDESASKLLNSFGVKGITYEGSVDGRCFVVFDDKAIDVLDTFYQSKDAAQAGQPRASVSFDTENDAKAIVTFFGSSDVSSAPHELYHIFRREMAETAKDPQASERVKQDWLRIQDFVGAEPGKPWTREMEEKFARAGERFLLEGIAPSRALQGVFEKLRQWFLELYADADAAGLHISDGMRSVFGNMFATPFEQSERDMRRSFGEMLLRNRVEDMEGMAADADRLAREMDDKPLEVMQEMAGDTQAIMAEAAQGLSMHDPRMLAEIEAEYAPAMAEVDTQIAKAQQVKDVLIQAALCEMRN